MSKCSKCKLLYQEDIIYYMDDVFVIIWDCCDDPIVILNRHDLSISEEEFSHIINVVFALFPNKMFSDAKNGDFHWYKYLIDL